MLNSVLNKCDARRRYKQLRANIDKNLKSNLDESICKNIIDSDDFILADAVLLYYPLGDEINTNAIFEKAIKMGKTVAYPKCYKASKTMRFYSVRSHNQLKVGAYGICEPDTDEPIDFATFKNIICIVPCLSCDTFGTRLGYGAGYYDRFFASHKNFTIKKIALCYEQCRADELYKDKFDVAVDIIATQNSLTEAKK